jgi:N-acetylglucosaminyldiphosphoundecaprenol N-acetyl-beta-D-mannosaminyltransferase
VTGVERITVVGIPVDIIRDEDFESTVLRLVQGGGFHQIVFLTLWDLLRALWDADYRVSVERASLVIPVSRGIIRGARFLGRKLPVRYLPFDFIIRFFSVLDEKGKSLYLLGLEQKYIQIAEQNLKQTFPGMRIVGRYTGFFPKAMEGNILLAIKKSSPHFVLVGSGVRGRDKWIYKNKKEFSQGIFLWNSSTLDVFSGKRKRVSRESFAKGREYLPDLLRRPWRVFRFPLYLYYGLLLLIYRIRKA